MRRDGQLFPPPGIGVPFIREWRLQIEPDLVRLDHLVKRGEVISRSRCGSKHAPKGSWIFAGRRHRRLESVILRRHFMAQGLSRMTMIRWLGVLFIGLTGFTNVALPAPAHRGPAQPPPQASGGQDSEMRIAAVVNDEVISVADLRSRLKMVMLSSNFPDSPETRQRITNQVLRTIVDEKLQLQEAKRQNVTATDEEIKKATSQIEKQNNMQPGQLDAFLKAQGIDRSSLIDQLTASIVWAKLVRRQMAQANVVSDEEIDDAAKRMKQNANEPQSRVAEIFLAVDNPQQDDEVRRLAVGIVAELLDALLQRGQRQVLLGLLHAGRRPQRRGA